MHTVRVRAGAHTLQVGKIKPARNILHACRPTSRFRGTSIGWLVSDGDGDGCTCVRSSRQHGVGRRWSWCWPPTCSVAGRCAIGRTSGCHGLKHTHTYMHACAGKTMDRDGHHQPGRRGASPCGRRRSRGSRRP